MARKYTPVGSFKMEGDVMRVSDPCYKKDVWCAGTIHNCKIGDWETAVVLSDEGQFGVRVAMLVAYHCDSGVSFSLADKILSDGRFVPGTGFEHCDFEVGVDSACAGLYDDSKFGLDEVFADAPPAPEYYGNGPGAVWYSHCCCATDNELRAGIIPYGVVSHSGFGDGGYDAYTHTGWDGKVDLVAIMYLAC